MKKVVLHSWIMMVVSSAAFGIFNPSWERPILSAEDMKIESAEFGFKDVNRVDMTLTKRDGQTQPTGIIVALTEGSAAPRVMTLEITHIEKDNACGSIRYTAHLPQSKGNPMGARFSVSLEDHSARICDDIRLGIWEAHIREGFGWCGTGDSTMTVSGNPETVFTVQRAN